jgi:hypothetical protein
MGEGTSAATTTTTTATTSQKNTNGHQKTGEETTSSSSSSHHHFAAAAAGGASSLRSTAQQQQQQQATTAVQAAASATTTPAVKFQVTATRDQLLSVAVEDHVLVGSEQILSSLHVSEGPGRIATSPVPSIYYDDRGEIHRIRGTLNKCTIGFIEISNLFVV